MEMIADNNKSEILKAYLDQYKLYGSAILSNTGWFTIGGVSAIGIAIPCLRGNWERLIGE